MPLNILIINQNADFCGNICRFLSSEGQNPVGSSEETALQKAVELRPDVIVIEVSIPELTSIEIVNRLQRSSSTKNIPVIVISDFPELEFEFLHLFDFISKPIDLKRLREDISTLSKGNKKRELPSKKQLTPDEHHKFHDFLIRYSGLHFERRNIKVLERGLESRMTALRITSYSDYYEYLAQNMERRQELQKLIQFLTVGETFFFRYHAHFEALAKNTLSDLMKLPAKKSLRIWSAGCSTGEEPYSIAMTIMEAIPDWKKRDIRIHATDINSRSLKRAREGVFSSWKMRVTPKHYIEKYFDVIGESYVIRNEVKSLVDFSYFNLQSSPPLTIGPFDIIFCRNVMIYFTTATTKKVVDMFAGCLTPGGYLYMGHSETLLNVSSRFERHIQEGSFYYRKKAVAMAEPEKPLVKTLVLPVQNRLKAEGTGSITPEAAPPVIAKPAVEINPENLFKQGLVLLHQENYAKATETFRELLQIKPQHTGAILAEGQIHLAQGRNEEALSCCDKALGLNDLLPEGYFLRGLLFEMDDRVDDAFEEYRKAVLLKIDFVMPHYQLGKLCFRTGDAKASARELRNCVKLLEKAGREAVIPFSGGLSREVFLAQARKEMAIVEAATD
jgi:chemotaxis protein methyltransferase CheR